MPGFEYRQLLKTSELLTLEEPKKQTTNFTSENLKKNVSSKLIHVIFSYSQTGRFEISQREIGVSDREIFAR